MKIIYKKGDLLKCEEIYLIHGCNAQGVMGAGVALAIKRQHPNAFEKYRKRWYEQGQLFLGDIVWVGSNGKVIGNAVTQEFYGRGGVEVSYDAVRTVMQSINEMCRDQMKVPVPPLRVAMPKIGAGLAGGDWDTIAQIIEEESTHFQPVVYEL